MHLPVSSIYIYLQSIQGFLYIAAIRLNWWVGSFVEGRICPIELRGYKKTKNSTSCKSLLISANLFYQFYFCIFELFTALFWHLYLKIILLDFKIIHMKRQAFIFKELIYLKKKIMLPEEECKKINSQGKNYLINCKVIGSQMTPNQSLIKNYLVCAFIQSTPIQKFYQILYQ